MIRAEGLWSLIEKRAEQTPDALFAVDEDDRTLSFAEYRAAAERCAAGLAERGFGAGDHVSWQLPRNVESMVLAGALARLGAIQNPILPIYREREVGFAVAQTGARLLVVPPVFRGFDHAAMANRIAAGHDDLEVLLVDDSRFARKHMRSILSGMGVERFHEANNGVEALELIKQQYFDLIITDYNMPEMDGIEACEIIRRTEGLEDTLITFLTARGEDYSQMAGFDAGADDYITKPIKPKVLVSKVKALLRRLKNEEQEVEDIFKVGEIVINREEYKIINKGEEIVLPRKEFELLALLTSKPNKVFKREVILDKVWGNEVVVGGRTIDVHIRKLREKIGDDHFKTVKGVGYKFVL